MIEVRPLTKEEYYEILDSVEDYHAVFAAFVNLSDIKFSNRYKTAWVEFYPGNSKPHLFLNEEFWNSLTPRERMFVICHECLHIFLDHGNRRGEYLKGATPKLINYAQDITINEMIVQLFKFDRNEFRDWKKYCWIDTCFPKIHATIERNREFTYYLEKLIGNKGDVPEKVQTVDEHGDGSPKDSEGSGEEKSDDENEKLQAAKKLGEELTPGELEALIGALGGKEAGNAAGTLDQVLTEKIKPPQLNVQRLIQRLKASRYKYGENSAESFKEENRRIRTSGDLVIPGNVSQPKPEKGKLLTAFFMDVSGSCMDHFPVFERVVAAFQAEENTFDLRVFAFDTGVQEITTSTRLRVGGGTSFNILETKVLDLAQEYSRYPDCVVVLTDGWGSSVSPKMPDRWIWLMTDDFSLQFVPSTSRHFLAREVVGIDPSEKL